MENLGEKIYTLLELMEIINGADGFCPHCHNQTLRHLPADAMTPKEDAAKGNFVCFTCSFRSSTNVLLESTFEVLGERYHQELAEKIQKAEKDLEWLKKEYALYANV